MSALRASASESAPAGATGSAAQPRATGAKRPRDTRARRAIGEAIARLARSFTARELYDLVLPTHSVGLTTVYRTLALLADEGQVREVGQRDGEMVYLSCTVSGHHHHLICLRCGAVEASAICHCDELERELAQEHGFLLDHAAENYYGLCATCAAETAADREASSSPERAPASAAAGQRGQSAATTQGTGERAGGV